MREKHQSVASHTPPNGDLACNPGMCPDQRSNWQPFGLQTSTQSTEPHQPGFAVSLMHLKLRRLHEGGRPQQGRDWIVG